MFENPGEGHDPLPPLPTPMPKCEGAQMVQGGGEKFHCHPHLCVYLKIQRTHISNSKQFPRKTK